MAIIKSRRPMSGKSLAVPGFPAFDELENRMRSFFESPLAPFDDAFVTQPIGWLPPMDIVESELELILTAELPGLEKKDVEIAVENGVLTLRGEKSEERKEDEPEKKYYLFERSYGSFNRSFTLPRFVDANKIAAEFEKGVLKIHLPKTAETKNTGRKIDIAVK
jgi:HSP20 family protein